MPLPSRALAVVAGINGAMAVGMGAWSAHGLSGQADLQALADRACAYQLVHAVAILALSRGGVSWGVRIGWVFAVGLLLFCGSLYHKAIWPGPFPIPYVTPLGGMTLIVAWLLVAGAALVKPGRK